MSLLTLGYAKTVTSTWLAFILSLWLFLHSCSNREGRWQGADGSVWPTATEDLRPSIQ